MRSRYIRINGMIREISNCGTASIDHGMWVYTTDGKSHLIIDEYEPIEPNEPQDKQAAPFWSKQGKTKKGGKRKY